MDEWMEKLDAILDKYGIIENREALKDDIYSSYAGKGNHL